jgi:hypothetical protein
MTSSASSPTSSPARSASPRLKISQPYSRTVGDVAAAAAESMGYRLLPWQREWLLDMGAVDERGKWVHPRVGGSIPRQQGKSVDGIVWVAVIAAVMGYKVLWSDHNYSTTMEMLNRFRDIFGSKPGDPVRGMPGWKSQMVDYCSQTGQEWMEFRSGGVIQFSTRTKSSRLGFSFDVVVYDEAQELTSVHTQVINPTTTSGAKDNLQLIYLGTPTRAGSPAEVFRDVRRQAWEGGASASDLLWVEYGVEEIGDIWDEARWWQVMPSLGAHASVRAVRAGMRDMDELAAAQEYLGYWLPETDGGDPPLLTAEDWEACLMPEAPQPARGERVAYGVKFSPDGASVALACAVRPPSGPDHVELQACSPTSRGTGWLADWLIQRARSGCSVAVDGRSGAGALCERLEQLRAPRGYVLRPTADQAVTAANAIFEGVLTHTVTHVADESLALSATTSTRRPIGKAGGWGWGGENAAPIEAAGLALWALGASKRDPSRKGKAG